MLVKRIEDMVGGWFVGRFEPTAFPANYEVAFKKHNKGELIEPHYHAKATEINLLVKGKMIINETELNAGDIFVIHPYEISIPNFLEDCEIVVVKSVSNTEDKYCVEIKNDF